MSEETTFLDGIAADRADRTRLLVFADWLADRADPREEFVRLHAKLLTMDGAEPGFAALERQWVGWTGGTPFVAQRVPKLSVEWLDALVRVCTTAEVDEYAGSTLDPEPAWAIRTEYGTFDHVDTNFEPTLVLYRGSALDYDRPFAFVTETLLADLREDPFSARGAKALAACYPITCGRFWIEWAQRCDNLRTPPPRPEIAVDNPFLAAQFVRGDDPSNWGIVAIYRDDYFALVWSASA
jgi:uncharacterized protein (TIGR02996 family)